MGFYYFEMEFLVFSLSRFVQEFLQGQSIFDRITIGIVVVVDVNVFTFGKPGTHLLGVALQVCIWIIGCVEASRPVAPPPATCTHKGTSAHLIMLRSRFRLSEDDWSRDKMSIDLDHIISQEYWLY
jgi:hypothetical protein